MPNATHAFHKVKTKQQGGHRIFGNYQGALIIKSASLQHLTSANAHGIYEQPHPKPTTIDEIFETKTERKEA